MPRLLAGGFPTLPWPTFLYNSLPLSSYLERNPVLGFTNLRDFLAKQPKTEPLSPHQLESLGLYFVAALDNLNRAHEVSAVRKQLLLSTAPRPVVIAPTVPIVRPTASPDPALTAPRPTPTEQQPPPPYLPTHPVTSTPASDPQPPPAFPPYIPPAPNHLINLEFTSPTQRDFISYYKYQAAQSYVRGTLVQFSYLDQNEVIVLYRDPSNYSNVSQTRVYPAVSQSFRAFLFLLEFDSWPSELHLRTFLPHFERLHKIPTPDLQPT